jgi:hypothetical protein
MVQRGLIVKERLIKSIREKEIQLAKLKAHTEKSTVCSDLYNKVVLEKAILKKELQNLDKNKFLDGIKNLLPHKKELICDYFKVK